MGVATITVSTRARRGSPGFGVSSTLAGGPRFEVGAHRRWRLDPELGQHRQGVGEGRRVGHRRSGADHAGVVVGHVGDQPRQHAGRLRGDREPAALDGREVLADRVHLADVRARPQQRAIDLLLVGQRQSRRGQGEQGRGAAGDQAQQQVVGRQALHLLEHAAGGGAALLVGHGMGGLDDLDALAGLAVAVARARPALRADAAS